MPESESTLIALREVSVRRGKREVLIGVDLDLSAGELMILTGPNGSGKSTLLEAAAAGVSLVSGLHHFSPTMPRSPLAFVPSECMAFGRMGTLTKRG